MSKKVIALMGSPRKNGNTDTLVKEVLRGAAEAGAETRLVHVAELNMKGCQGCYSCKQRERAGQGCILEDDMTPLYREIEEADVVVFGSPVYMSTMSAQLKLVLDRLFPYIIIDGKGPLPKGKRCALIFTQNQIDPRLFAGHFDMTALLLQFMGFEAPEVLVSVDTIGYKGSPDTLALPEPEGATERKNRHKETEFPRDMQMAHEMGKRLAGQ